MNQDNPYQKEELHESGWALSQVTAWKKGTWTKEQVLALERIADEHIDNCEVCQTRLEIDPRTLPDDEPYYCPIGESLSEEYSWASTEYSWQGNFEPGWHKE